MFAITSPPTTSRRKRAATSPAPEPYLQPQTQITNHASSGDTGGHDLFDLFSIMDNVSTDVTPVQAPANTQTYDNGFEDLFADFSTSFSTNAVKTQVPAKTPPKPSNSNTDELSPLKTISRPRHRSRPQKEIEEEPVFTRPTSKSEYSSPHSKKYVAKNLKTRPSSPPVKASKNGLKKKKMKKIDVLPLLHKGIRANKFKLNGNKSKVRKFFVTDNNYFFCWDAVNASINYPSTKNGSNTNTSNNTKKSGGFFSKITGGGNKSTTKVDASRSIPIRAIRSLVKNAAYTMQTYSFIPPSQKSLTISIVYVQNGSEKRLNFMNYEPFHNVLFFEGLSQLWDASKNPNRNLSEVFELYVDFSKDILPKHLRPQKFKWEPLGDGDYNTSASEDNGNTLNPFFDNSGAHKNVNLFDPTANNASRTRLKSF